MSAIRDATPADAARCAAIYAPYVRDTAITFELVAPSATQMARRIADAHAWLVLEDGGDVVGYAYAVAFRSREAYRHTCETSIYLEIGRRRTGGGRSLYAGLLARVTGLGFHLAVGGMTLPNPASEGLHRALGFRPVGVFCEVGSKFGAWHDVGWVQRRLAEQPAGDRAIPAAGPR